MVSVVNCEKEVAYSTTRCVEPANQETESGCGAAASDWFARLYSDYYTIAHRFARKLVGAADADDIVQDAFLRIAKYRGAKADALSASFIFATVRNTAIDLINARSRERVRHEKNTQYDLYRDRHTSPSEGIGAFERRHLRNITDSQREALILVEVMGLSEAQAGLVMDLSRPVVSAKVGSAVKTLRAMANENDLNHQD